MFPARTRSFVLLALLAAAAVGGAAATQPATRPTAGAAAAAPAPVPADIELKDVDGTARRPLAAGGDAKAAVVFFLSHDCPISNGYAPEVNRICREYAAGGRVAFAVVHPYRELPADAARKHAKEYGYTVPVFVDTNRTLTRSVGAKVTPEVAVVGPGGALLYRGRIDDAWTGYGKRRPEPTTRELRAALDAVLAGRPVPVAGGEAVGCPIED